MIGTVFGTEDIPAEHRLEHWRDLMARTRGCDVSAEAPGFRAESRLMELGPVTVWSMAVTPTRYRRCAKMVRRSDPERYHLSLLREGSLRLHHAGRAETFRPGELHLADSSQPYDLRLGEDERFRGVPGGVGVDFPRALLPVPPQRVRDLLGRGLPGHEGLGGLLAQFLTGLEQQAGALRPADAPRLGGVLLDLIATWVGEALAAEATLPGETRQSVLAHRIRAFIRQNLPDPELSPPLIASAHHISVSYLHRIFEQQSPGEPVAAWIRARRLENAHRDLADAASDSTPIHLIAARWGFRCASDFTRAFRAAYGLSPREHRMRARAARS